MVLDRDRAGEPGGPVRQQVCARLRIRRDRDREIGGTGDDGEIVEQCRCGVRLRDIEIDRAAVERVHDRAFGQLHVSAEDGSALQIYFARGRDGRVFHAAAAGHHHRIVGVELDGACQGVAFDFDPAVPHRMDPIRHAAPAHDQLSAVLQRGLVRQTAVHDQTSCGTELRPAHGGAAFDRHGSGGDHRVKAEAAFRHHDLTHLLPHVIFRDLVPGAVVCAVEPGVPDHGAARHGQRAASHLGVGRDAAGKGHPRAIVVDQSPGRLSAFKQGQQRIAPAHRRVVCHAAPQIDRGVLFHGHGIDRRSLHRFDGQNPRRPPSAEQSAVVQQTVRFQGYDAQGIQFRISDDATRFDIQVFEPVIIGIQVRPFDPVEFAALHADRRVVADDVRRFPAAQHVQRPGGDEHVVHGPAVRHRHRAAAVHQGGIQFRPGLDGQDPAAVDADAVVDGAVRQDRSLPVLDAHAIDHPAFERDPLGRGFRRIPCDGQGQRAGVQVQRVGVPSEDQRIAESQIAIIKTVVLNRDRAGKPGRAFCQQIRARGNTSGNRDRKARSSVDQGEVVEQRRGGVRLRQVEVDPAAFERVHDRAFGKLHASAEDAAVLQVHVASGCDVHVLRAPPAFHHEHVAGVELDRTRHAVGSDFDRRIAHGMDVPCHAAVLHFQHAAVRQHGLGGQAAVHKHLSAVHDLRPARDAALFDRLGTGGDQRIQDETTLRNHDLPELFIVPVVPAPVVRVMRVQFRVPYRSPGGHMQGSEVHLCCIRFRPGDGHHGIVIVQQGSVCPAPILQDQGGVLSRQLRVIRLPEDDEADHGVRPGADQGHAADGPSRPDHGFVPQDCRPGTRQ